MPGISRLLRRRRRGLFWAVAAVALSLPWVGQSGIWRELIGLWPSTLESCAVLNVHDGDTMRVQCGNRRVKVRLHCIDAPELKQAPWGREARDYLRSLVGRGPVTVRVKDKDKYRRSVAEVWKDGTSMNLKMIQAGKVAVYWQHCNSATYGLAEWKARLVSAGIWRQRGLHQRPWKYRH